VAGRRAAPGRKKRDAEGARFILSGDKTVAMHSAMHKADDVYATGVYRANGQAGERAGGGRNVEERQRQARLMPISQYPAMCLSQAWRHLI